MDKTAENKIRYQQIFEQLDPNSRKTKIICTLGPACQDIDMLVKMLDAGMNVARLNMSQGDHKTHGQCIENLQMALKERPDKTCAVMLDTKGPEITTGLLRDSKPIDLVAGQTLKIVTDFAIEGDNQKIACSFKNLPTTISVGSTIFIDDGALTCEVQSIQDDHIVVTCLNSLKLGEKKIMNLPGAIIDLPVLTEGDESDLKDFGIPSGVDIVAASFVRKASDVEYIRDKLGPKGAYIKIFSKIQNHEGLHNYEEILAVSDGIMVNRVDLGMEIPPEKVFVAQKFMLEKANHQSKQIINATEMLGSMSKTLKPTRPEASDVANAVMDGNDCLMLSNESATGDYPVEALQIMAKICTEAEKTIDYKRAFNDVKAGTSQPIPTAEVISATICKAVLDQSDISLIIICAETGKLPRLVSKYKPEVLIFACSTNGAVVRQSNTLRGVVGQKVATLTGDEVLQQIIKKAKDMGLAKPASKIAVLQASNEDTREEQNQMKIVDIE